MALQQSEVRALIARHKFRDMLLDVVGLVVMLTMMLILAALFLQLVMDGGDRLTADFFQNFPSRRAAKAGILAAWVGSLLVMLVTALAAVPVGVAAGIWLEEYAPKSWFSEIIEINVNNLAGVPSIIYGLWGLQVLMNHMEGITKWLNDYLGFIPLFNNEIGIYTKSIFIASVVLAIMILPTISALSREVFIQVPRDHREASLALGATRWEMIRMAVLPFGRPGIISATMLGLGRALGETIAVALILSAAFETNWHITEPGGNTFAANIALKWNEAGPIGLSALIASGLILFIITLVVNMIARAIIAKHKEFSGANS